MWEWTSIWKKQPPCVLKVSKMISTSICLAQTCVNTTSPSCCHNRLNIDFSHQVETMVTWDNDMQCYLIIHQKHQLPDAKGTNRFEAVNQSLKLSFILESSWKNHHQCLKLYFDGGILFWKTIISLKKTPVFIYLYLFLYYMVWTIYQKRPTPSIRRNRSTSIR